MESSRFFYQLLNATSGNRKHANTPLSVWPVAVCFEQSILFFVARGRGADFIKGKRHALRGLKRALGKRKHIQKNRTVTDDYIWSLFEKERLLPRLTRRMSKMSS
jgi:hypothetical protein